MCYKAHIIQILNQGDKGSATICKLKAEGICLPGTTSDGDLVPLSQWQKGNCFGGG